MGRVFGRGAHTRRSARRPLDFGPRNQATGRRPQVPPSQRRRCVAFLVGSARSWGKRPIHKGKTSKTIQTDYKPTTSRPQTDHKPTTNRPQTDYKPYTSHGRSRAPLAQPPGTPGSTNAPSGGGRRSNGGASTGGCLRGILWTRGVPQRFPRMLGRIWDDSALILD